MDMVDTDRCDDVSRKAAMMIIEALEGDDAEVLLALEMTAFRLLACYLERNGYTEKLPRENIVRGFEDAVRTMLSQPREVAH